MGTARGMQFARAAEEMFFDSRSRPLETWAWTMVAPAPAKGRHEPQGRGQGKRHRIGEFHLDKTVRSFLRFFGGEKDYACHYKSCKPEPHGNAEEQGTPCLPESPFHYHRVVGPLGKERPEDRTRTIRRR